MRHKFWSDSFDMDLLKVIPESSELLSKFDDIPIYAHCTPTFGRLNCPSCWNTHSGLLSFFSFHPGVPCKPAAFWTSCPIVECTFEEAMRDVWAHDYILAVEGETIWLPKHRTEFDGIMYDLRKWTVRDPETVKGWKRTVLRSIEISCAKFSAAAKNPRLNPKPMEFSNR